MPDEVFASDAGRVIGRYGDTVARKAARWTPAVHRLLHFLEEQGFPDSPRVIGVDGEVETLSYIAGVSGAEAWGKVSTDTGLETFVESMRRYHDTIRQFDGTGEWAFAPNPADADVIVCHGDFGPWNTVWQEDRMVGILDWDFAAPRPALHDVGYALEYLLPFRDDEECVRWLGYDEPPDRRHRFDVAAAVYGLPPDANPIDLVIAAQDRTLREVQLLAEEGLEPQGAWIAAGHEEKLRERQRWIRSAFRSLVS